MNNTVNRASLGAKKNKIFKSGFVQKLKFLLIPIGLLIGSLTTQVLAKRIYLHPAGGWSDSSAKFVVWDGSNNYQFQKSTVSYNNFNYWYADIKDDPSSSEVYLKRMDKDADIKSEGWNSIGVDASSHNMFYAYKENDNFKMSGVNVIGLVEGGYIYFDNSVTQWSGKIQFVIGHDTYSKAYEMSQVVGTQIWYVSIQDESWRDANYYAFGAKSSVVSETNWTKTDLGTKFTKYTAAYTSEFYLSDDATYICTPSGASNGSSFSIEYKGSGYSAIASTFTHNLYVHTRTQLDGSTPSYGTSLNSPTMVNIKGYQMTGNGEATQLTSSVTTSGMSTSLGSIISTSTVSSDYTALGTNSPWTFDGWAESASGPSDANSTYSIENAKAAKSIYAYFSKRTYTVSFNLHGYGSAIDAQTKDYYGTVSQPSTPTTASAYVFRGWWKEDTYVNQWNFASDHVTGTTTLHAKWLSYVNVVYNKGANGTGENVTDKKVTGENLTIRGALFTRDGYTQTGWATEDGGSKVYDFSDTYSTQTALILYPVWTANSYTIAFDANDGTATGSTASVEATYDQNVTLTANGFARSGYFFAGWSENSDGSGTQYTDAQTLTTPNLTSEPCGTVTLYAKWTHVPALADITATPESYNYQGEDITLNLQVTSTYLATPTVKFYVNDGNSTEVVTGTRKGDGDDEDETIGSAGSNYSTIHKATLIITAAGTYHITAKLFNGAGEDPVQDEKGIDVTADASDVVINMVYDVTIVGGRESSSSSATTVKATPNVANGYYATAYVTALDFPEGEYGMKFTGWKLSSGITLADGSNLTDREIHFYAAGRNGTVTAQYAKREYVMLRFAAVPGWDHVYVYTWDDSNKSDENATYPGVEITSNTSTDFDGVTYYYYGYYAEGDGIGGSSTGKTTWDKVIFNNGTNPGTQYGTSNWNATKNLDLVDGHYYHYTDDADGSESLYDWYVMGTWNGVSTWDYSHPADILGNSIVRDLKNQKQEFKIFRASTNEWFKYDADSDGASEEDAAVIGTTMTLSKNVGGNNAFTPDETAGYKFTLVKDDDTPTLTITKLEDSDIAVTVEAAANGSITAGAGDINIHQYTTTTITAAANAGYRFKKWTVDKEHKAYIHFEDSTSASTKIYAVTPSAAGATIIAQFTNEGFIYFDKKAVKDAWSGDDVYVTFFTDNNHWVEYYEGEVKKERVKIQNYVSGLMSQKMNRISDTYIYYLDTKRKGDPTQWYMFTDKDMEENGTTWYQAATCRSDFSSESGCNLFVIENYVEKTVAGTGFYYGCWMKYREEEAGIKLELYDGSNQELYGSPFTFTRSDLDVNTFTTTVPLNGDGYYRIELLGDNNIYYKNSGNMLTNSCTGWQYTEREATVGHITTTGEGDYTFTLSFETTPGEMKMSATYPLAAGDYRIVYNGKTYVGDEDDGDFVGPIIKKWTSGTQTDKVSFFVTDAATTGMDWNLRVQSCSIAGSTVTWNDVAEKVFDFSALNGKTGVYVFDVKQTSASDITIENPEVYTGNYYIRTDIAEGRWEAYKEAPDNKMVHSEWAEKHSDYNYYHCHYIKDLTSVKFTVANDYSSSISGVLNTDSYTDGDGKLSKANVRFSYNSATNVIKRAYIGGSSEDNEYLNIVSPVADYVFTSGGTDLYNAEAVTRKFVDMGNWVYQMDIKAYPTATAKVTAHFNDDTQYFVGSESTAETILGGESKGSTKYNLRAIYDFKNNHLITSWLADGTVVGTSMAINADLMIIRRQQGAGAQISFTGDGKSLSNVKTIYGVVQFDYDDMVGQLPNWNVYGAYGKLVYYISFPFDVNIKDIFGSAGNMNDQWIVQTYNGARRAKEGWFADSESFWEDMTEDSVMLANHGYVLIIDRPSFNSSSSVVWTNKSSGSSVYLYFPSASEADKTITNDTKTVTAPAHKCNIDRWFMGGSGSVNHMNTDSHWNMIGSPLFESKYATTVSATAYEVDGLGEETSTKFNYFYEWDPGTNTYFVTSIDYSRFKSLHGYMVQFAGTVTFTGATLSTPALVAARHKAEDKNYKINLQMTNADNAESHTFVELRENACDTFALNEDMYMMRSSKTVDLYTYAGSYDVAANVLSVGNHIIPVGMDVKKAGTYTFSMPSNFSGTVTLVDNVANTRTNLAMEDYEVVLNKGLVEGRFYLELDIQEVATAIDGVEDGSLKDGKAHKFIQNGQMYILQDGKIYDARGNRVQ